MAFKILNMDEIELLDEKQKAQYDEDLILYQQRVTFIEQIERWEQADIDPYQPKLLPVDMIEELDFQSYKKPEYILTVCEPAEKPDVKVSSFKTLKPEPVLPAFEKKPELVIKHSLKIDQLKPDLPLTEKPVILVNKYYKIKAKSPDLPEVIKPEMVGDRYEKPQKVQPMLPDTRTPFAVMPAGQINLTREDLLKDFPDTSVPELSLKPFALPPAEVGALPLARIIYTETKNFQKPEVSNIELPVTVSPNLSYSAYKEIKREQPDLPKASKINFRRSADFQKPQFIQIESPKIVNTDLELSYTRLEASVSPKLPAMSVAKVPVGNFSIAEPVLTNLPIANKLNIETKSFEKPYNHRPILPTAVKLRVIDKVFSRMEKQQTDVVKVPVPCAPSKTFLIPKAAISMLPARSTAQIPGIDNKLTKLMSVIHEEYHTLIG